MAACLADCSVAPLVDHLAGSRAYEKADLMVESKAVSSVVKRAGEKAASTAVY